MSYNLMRDEKRAVCQWLRAVKVPIGFSSNIKSLVSMTGYAAKMEQWRQEEREAAETGQPNPL
jgi:hypothetical protein